MTVIFSRSLVVVRTDNAIHMRLLTLCGSTRPDSSNQRLLESLVDLVPSGYTLEQGINLGTLPLFRPDIAPTSEVLQLRRQLSAANAIVISTPAYLENLPAVLKNALEWLVDTGELYEKPVLAITYTPHPPRGEQAMQSLLWSLQALNARVVVQLPLFASEQMRVDDQLMLSGETKLLLQEALALFG